MRFIIHEQSYEQPLAAGKWRYSQDNQPTGAVEEWRLSDAVDGYRFLRVDLDARTARSGRSYLYHLTMDHFGNPVQLKFRLWERDLEIIGSVLLEKDSAIVTREFSGQRFEKVLPLPEGYAFWYPASTGLGLLANWQTEKTGCALGLLTETGSRATEMSPFITNLELSYGAMENLEVMNEMRMVRPLTISWNDQKRTLWINDNNWPLIMARPDGLTAVETRYIHYQRISKPGKESDEGDESERRAQTGSS